MGSFCACSRRYCLSRYPVDLGHNFVLAHNSCNNAKGAILAAEEHLGRWAERNRDLAAALEEACDRVRMTHDLNASRQVAAWAYEQAAASGGLLWRSRGSLVPISEQWRAALGSN